MATSYIPGPDADFLTWVSSFSALITAAPISYGLTSDDATALAALVATFSDALAASTNGSTRGPMTVAAKNTARTNCEGRARQLAGIIQKNSSVTVEQKTALKITVPKTNRTPIPAPETNPALVYIASTPLEQTYQYRTTSSLDNKSRPFGATMLQVSVWVAPIGTTPSGPPTQQFDVTRNPFAIEFGSGDVGKMATVVARWKTARALVGPPSVPISQAVA